MEFKKKRESLDADTKKFLRQSLKELKGKMGELSDT